MKRRSYIKSVYAYRGRLTTEERDSLLGSRDPGSADIATRSAERLRYRTRRDLGRADERPNVVATHPLN